MITSPAGLVLVAALLALAAGVIVFRRGRRDARARPSAVTLPTLVALLARVPAPRVVRRLLGGTPPEGVLVAAGLAPAELGPVIPRARAGGAIAGIVIGASLGFIAPPLLIGAPVGALVGRAFPDQVLGSRARRRREIVVDALPDLLDLMVICVEAGMALDPALGMAAGRLGGPLGDEVRTTLADQSLGTPRRGAYRALADRTGSADVARLVASLLQAEELGTPLATALAGQAEALRAVRRQAARDRAARAAPRIQLVVALIMVPGALLLVLGIMLVELAGQVGIVMGGP